MSSTAYTPGEPDEINFYDAARFEPHLLYQGEVLADVPILNMPKPTRWLLLRTKSGKPLDEALKNGQLGGLAKVLDSNQTAEEWDAAPEGDFAMARLSKRPVLLLSQTCDIQNKNFIQVAPIFSVEGDAQYVEKLKRGEILSAFWMPKRLPQLPSDGYADFELIQAVHKSYIKSVPLDQHFRLSAASTRLLQRSITRYFGRPNSFDAGADVAPIAGVYLCVACFYLDARISSVQLNAGESFRFCDTCKGRAWIIKGR